MASSVPSVARCCQCALRSNLRTSVKVSSRSLSTTSRTSTVLSQRRHDASSRRWASTAPNPKINQIVDQIGQLTLLETADLVSTLKTRLNIPDLPVGNFAAGPAQAAPAAVEEEEAAPKAEEKTLFNITLKSFEPTAKPKVIKEIKSLLNLSLVESKKFAESAPKQMQENISKEDAQKIIDQMKALGAVVVME